MIIETKTKLNELIQQFKDELAARISAERISNPDIKVVSDKPRAFTMKASALTVDSLDPFYYDYDAQFDYLLDKLEKQSIDAFINAVTKLVGTGKIDGRRFAPAVIEKIKTLL